MYLHKCTHLDDPTQLDAAVAAASAAFPAWRDTPVQQRQRVMFKLQHLIHERTDALAESITREQVRGEGGEGRKGAESAHASDTRKEQGDLVAWAWKGGRE